jgi:hypothetical protein
MTVWRSASRLALAASSALMASVALAQPPPAKSDAAAAPGRKVVHVGERPESLTRGFGGKYYITVMNGHADADGVVKVLDGDTARNFATELDEPKGICFTGKVLIVSDVKRIWRIDRKGNKSLLVDEDDFPQPPSFLNDVACEPGGKAVFVSDMGANTKMRDPQGKLWPLAGAEAKALPAVGRVYRIGLDSKISVAVDSKPELPCPNGVAAPARGRLLVAEFFTGTIFSSQGQTLTALATGLRGADGLEEDARGNIYVSSWDLGKVWRIPRPSANKPSEPQVIAEGFQSAADFFLDRRARQLVLPDMKAGTVTFIPLR